MIVNAEKNSKLIGSKEAASWLNVSLRTLWVLRNSGQIRHLRIGRKILFSTEWLEEFVQQNAVGGMYNVGEPTQSEQICHKLWSHKKHGEGGEK